MRIRHLEINLNSSECKATTSSELQNLRLKGKHPQIQKDCPYCLKTPCRHTYLLHDVRDSQHLQNLQLKSSKSQQNLLKSLLLPFISQKMQIFLVYHMLWSLGGNKNFLARLYLMGRGEK